MARISAALYADLIGKPFARGGRGPAEFDCVGLALEMQRRLGRELPVYLSDEAALHRAIDSGGPLHEALEIPKAEAGCVVLMRSDLEPGRHLGVMVDPHRMLHTYGTLRSSCIVVLEQTVWRARVMGFYRVGDCA